MAGLREKQKADRQRRILEAARQQFRRNDYRKVTVEAIAAEAELSTMTVFNYYGSKGGLLLALVAESDRHLIKKINAVLEGEQDDAVEAVISFSLTIIEHGFSYLNRQTWGHVLATAMVEGNSAFGRGFAALEGELVRLLSLLLARLKGAGRLVADCDETIAATVLYNVHNARFMEYAADPELSRERVQRLVEQDLRFIVARLLPAP